MVVVCVHRGIKHTQYNDSILKTTTYGMCDEIVQWKILSLTSACVPQESGEHACKAKTFVVMDQADLDTHFPHCGSASRHRGRCKKARRESTNGQPRSSAALGEDSWLRVVEDLNRWP